jgi:hypothetical protein
MDIRVYVHVFSTSANSGAFFAKTGGQPFVCHLRSTKMPTFVLVVLALFAIVPAAAAQERTPAQNEVGVAFGVMNFDLSGVGNTWVTTVRGTRALTDHLAVEAGVSIARPQQTFDRVHFIAPEAQLQYFWKVGRVRPYAGGGVGFVYRDSDLYNAKVNLALSTSGGARIDLSNTAAVFGELRLRGIDRNFGASTAEWFGGVIWRL